MPETEQELLSRLRSQTRDLPKTPLDRFTTRGLAQQLSISRNLASHYLNDLVRLGGVVKAGSRPVYYFARRDLERMLQTSIDRSVYDSVEELLSAASDTESRDFERVIGYDLSLASTIEKLKAAIRYPPSGLPVLMTGDKGTGKTLLASCMFEYGRRIGALEPRSRLVVVDCARYVTDPDTFAVDLKEGSSGGEGLLREASGGVLVFRNAELLSPSAVDALLGGVLNGAGGVGVEEVIRPVFLSTCSESDLNLAAISRSVPVRAHVPSLRERTAEEREELVLSLFKEEGRRLGADVFVSRTVFSCLVEADFEDNVTGLRSCITSCCASAYLDHASERLDVQAFLLPGPVLEAASSAPRSPSSREEDTDMIDTTRSVEHAGDGRSVRVFSSMLEMYQACRSGSIDSGTLIREVMACLRDYEDYLVFEVDASSSRVTAYEHIISGVMDDVSTTYGLDLSKKSARVVARCLYTQIHSGSRLSRWCAEHLGDLSGLFSLLLDTSDFSRLVTERTAFQIRHDLGINPDVLTKIVVFGVVSEARRHGGRRQSVGIILSHGYSTATSIADAANRILHERVYEAIDMSYDQEVKDILRPLRSLLERYSFCREAVILVDMGSLEGVLEDVGNISNLTLGIVNNASTGVALEIGAGLVAGESLADLLPAATAACVSRYRIVEGSALDQAVLFCSKGGVQAAERIKNLIECSLEAEYPLAFVACSPQQIRREGLLERFDVLAIIGTDDPGIDGVPFIALEDIISGEGGRVIDRVFARYLDENAFERFHRNLVKNLTLRNVIESITILNPEKVLEEVEAAVNKLQMFMNCQFSTTVIIGLCVHLCCLIERLVTHNPIESYVDVESFEADHGDFIEFFRQSFTDIAHHYGVDVPMAEIAYAFDYVSQSTKRAAGGGEKQ